MKKSLSLPFILKVVFILLILTATWAIFFFFGRSYLQFISYVIEHYYLSGKTEKLMTLISVERYNQLRLFLLFLLVALIVSVFIINYEGLAEKIINNIKEFNNTIKYAFIEIRELGHFTKISLLVALVAYIIMQLYYLFEFPFTIDEAASYVFFISKGLLVSATYYPGTNNHILFSETAVVFNSFFHNPIISVRLPCLLASTVTILILFIYLKNKFGLVPALLGAILFAFSSPNLFFSIQGRGYALLNLFVLVSFISLQQALVGKRVFGYLFVLSSILGFYDMIIFLYPFASFIVYALIKYGREKKVVIRLLLYGLVVAFGVILLYLPVLLLSGYNAISGNPWLIPLQNFFTHIPEYFSSVGSYFWSSDSYGLVITIILLLLSLLLAFFKRDKNMITFLACVYFVPLLIMLCQQILPFERIWAYFLIILAFQVAYIAQLFLQYDPAKRLVTAFCLVLALGFMARQTIHFYSFYTGGYANYYRQLNTFMDTLFQKSPASVYVEDDTYNVFIRYKWMVNNKSQPDIEIVPNDIKHNYDCVIVPVNANFPSSLNTIDYQFFYLNHHIKAYLYQKGSK